MNLTKIIKKIIKKTELGSKIVSLFNYIKFNYKRSDYIFISFFLDDTELICKAFVTILDFEIKVFF